MKERTNERKQPSQLDQILAVLESGGTLTALVALEVSDAAALPPASLT